MPPISVIIPVHNGAKTIAETVESVLAQTFADFELIVVESGSTDNTAEILATIQDPRLKVLSYAKAPVSINRNRGVSQATGEFVSFLDADDLWTPDKLEAQHAALLAAPEAALAYSWTNCIDTKGKFLRRCSYVHWSGNVLEKLLLDDFIGNGSNVMIRRQAFLDVGGFDEALTNAEDTDLCLRLALKYPFAVVPKAQVLYRIAPNSKSSNIQRMETCNLRVIEKAYELAPEQYQYLKPYSLGNLYKYLLYRSLEVEPGKQQTGLILKFLYRAIATDVSLLQKKVIYKAFIKLLVLTMVPEKGAIALMDRFHQAFNTSTFLGYEITNLDAES
ncbi:MAG: glycosyltransferase [Cyanobacteria bacterium P01_F01_bin.86]